RPTARSCARTGPWPAPSANSDRPAAAAVLDAGCPEASGRHWPGPAPDRWSGQRAPGPKAQARRLIGRGWVQADRRRAERSEPPLSFPGCSLLRRPGKTGLAGFAAIGDGAGLAQIRCRESLPLSSYEEAFALVIERQKPLLGDGMLF